MSSLQNSIEFMVTEGLALGESLTSSALSALDCMNRDIISRAMLKSASMALTLWLSSALVFSHSFSETARRVYV